MADKKERPLLITIIAILYFILGILTVMAGAIILVFGIATVAAVVPATVLGGALIVLGLVPIVIAGGFWNGWKAIWYIAVIFGIIAIIVDVISLFANWTAIIGVIIQALLLYYIFRPKVKEFFGV